MNGRSVEQLLLELKARDIHLRRVDDQLRVSTPAAGLPAELRDELKAYKQEILDILKAAQQDEDSSIPVIASNNVSPAPLSFGQQRLWFVHELNKSQESPYDTLTLNLRIRGELNVDALERSLIEILHRHEVLRTIFVLKDDEPRQMVRAASLEFEQEDISQLPLHERECRLAEILQAAKNFLFDLATGPLFKTRLIRLGRTEHVLNVIVHHIAFDGWSNGILMGELKLHYENIARERSSPPPELPIQYRDFSIWQRTWLQGGELQKHLSYWIDQLANLPSLDLPTDRPRPAVQTFNGASETLSLSRELSADLKSLSNQKGVTLYMTILAVLGILLHRYSDQDDFGVGTPIANRDRKEVQNLIGFFLNMLVMRLDLSGDPSFTGLLERVKHTALAGYAHQHVPFEKLVEEMGLDREKNRTPLFQISFTMLDELDTGSSQLSDNLEFSRISIVRHTTRFDLEVYVKEDSAGLALNIIYNTDLFEAPTIIRMLSHFEQLLDGVVRNPEQSIDVLPLLTEPELRRQLVEWNDTSRDYPRTRTVQGLFEDQAASSPNSIAVAYERETLSYRDLNERANRLAHYLIAAGVKPDMAILVLMERTPDLVVAQLAVLKAGAAYVAIDPEYPTQRLAFILEDTGSPMLVTQSSLSERVKDYRGLVLCLDSDVDLLSDQSILNPAVAINADNLAYVNYTSGSTGTPKGVEIPHRGLTNLVSWYRRAFEVRPEDRSTHLAGLGFDASAFELWPCLSSGATIYLVSNERRLDLAGLLPWMAEQGITLSFLPTPLAEAVLSEPVPDGLKLRILHAGGDRLHGGLAKKPVPFRLVNNYGPTENSIVTTWAEVDVCARNDPTIGRPIDNVQAYVLDKKLQPVPVGVWGELYIGGEGLMRGYLNQPELTAEKLIPNPFSTTAGSRLYRSGDFVRYREDGQIEFRGRLDNQVKLRGFRIELGEIENFLLKHEAVQNAVVLIHEEEGGEKRLVAYVLPEKNSTATAQVLHQHIRNALPEYMLPSAFVFIDELPMTPNGKVDRAALPVPDDLWANRGAVFIAPRTEAEERLARIWGKVLKLDRVGVHDNFFDLGGHSLMATQVVSRIRNQLNAELPLSEMFVYPTVAELAPVVESLLNKGDGEEKAGIVRVADRESDLPLSFAQERLWFLDQLEPGSTAYNMALALRLKGELSVPALENSLHAIVSRQEGLRTHFILHQGKPFQVIDDTTIELEQDDLSALLPEAREDEVKARIDAEALRPFDLSTGPLLRCRLLRLSDREHVLLLTMHHVISDGWSLGVLFRELGACYAAFSQGELPALDELSIQYADFAVWQREWLSGEVLASQMAYWREKLEDLPTLNLPTDRPRPAVQTYTGSSERITLDADMNRRLTALSRQAGVTLVMVLLGGFASLMHRYSGQEDIVVGTPIANRNRAELEELIGFFVNSLVMRTDVSGSPDFMKLIQRVNRTALEAYEHQDLPFEKLVDEIQPERDLSHNPLFQVMFALQNAPMESLELKGLTLESFGREIKVTGFDVECHVLERGDQLEVVFVYNTDLFDASTIRRMMKHYRHLLIAATASPETPVGELEILDDKEKQLMLHQWNQTRAEFVEKETLHSLIEQQVERTPRAEAVRFEQQSLDYSELERKANDLACLLLAKDVKPGQLVGIFLERSIDLVVAILGILKAGAAYVPLDPEYPDEHVNYMVADSNIRILLSQNKFENQLPSGDADIVYLDSGKLYENVEAQTLPVVTEDMLAYVVYTSGSTGKPKAVMISHAAVINHAFWMQGLFKIDQTDRILQKSPISFDASVCEIFVSLLNGATIVLAVPGGDRDIDYLIQEIRNNEITTLTLVPSALRMLLTELTDPAALCSLKRVGSGGEALTLDLVQAYYEKCSAPLYNLYGPTESTIDATSFLCQADFNHDNIPIGTPISNIRVYNLDSRLQPVPIGVYGELHIGGAGLARGYLNQPELTAEKFIADPFSDDPEARLYKTGDLVRYREDGNIEYIGRIDHQVKLRGFRIELGEIESALASLMEVRESAVMVREDRPGDKRLVAYVVVEKGESQAPSVANLRDFLRQKLPEYMVPSAFVILDRLPLNASGKLDRHALPMPDGERQSGEAFVEPRSDLERRMAEIWREVLGVAQVGIHDNFFDLGGHSLKLIELHNRLREEVEVPLSLVDLFAFPSISTLVEHIVKPQTLESSPPGDNDRFTHVAVGSQRLKQLRQKRQRNTGVKA